MYKKWRASVDNETCSRLKCLRSNNGGEYCNKEFENFCVLNAIRREKVVPHTSQQNNVAKQINKWSRSIRLHAGLSKQFWVDAVSVAA